MKSKNKLVPRLLGITKESVMRVEEKTKDVVQEWPLTTVKRWAASPKSFTLVRHTYCKNTSDWTLIWLLISIFPHQRIRVEMKNRKNHKLYYVVSSPHQIVICSSSHIPLSCETTMYLNLYSF